MSLEAVLARMGQLQSAFAPPAATPVAAPATAAPATPAPPTSASAMQLQNAGTAAPLMNTPGPASSAGQAVLNAVRGEVGVREQPPGSNDSPRIAQYRQATAGSGVGPWCSYFVSWAARGAGVPIGDQGQGYGAVSDVWSWAQRTGKAIPAGTQPPQPGDLIVWNGRH